MHKKQEKENTIPFAVSEDIQKVNKIEINQKSFDFFEVIHQAGL